MSIRFDACPRCSGKESTNNILEAKASNGLSKFWRAFVCPQPDGSVLTCTQFWHQTINGESVKTLSDHTRIIGKNIGRANETTPLEQAILEMTSTTKTQTDKGYHLLGETVTDKHPLPMLAQEYKKAKHRLGSKVAIQPKLDGMRACSNGKVMWSRKGLPIIKETYQHLLDFNHLGYILDGEMVLPAPYGFQDTMKAAKKYRPELFPPLTYVVFDIVDPTLTFSERYGELVNMFEGNTNPNIILCPTYFIDNDAMLVKQYHNQFTDAGYEGSIIRATNGTYLCGHRSSGLLKFKDFIDAESLVKDIIGGSGKFEDVAMCVCEVLSGVGAGKTFTVNLAGWSLDDRKDMLRNKEQYIGKLLTVKFQRYSDDGIPIFARGIAIRDENLQG